MKTPTDRSDDRKVKAPTQYGGQAVIEGVMMRSPRWTSTAVRGQDGVIAVFTEARVSLLARHRWLRAPVIRGTVTLYEAVAAGVRALLLSANAALGAERHLTPRRVHLSVMVGLGLAIGLFIIVPAAAVRLLEGSIAGVVLLNLAEGVLRIAILIGYLGSIGRLADVRRLFGYHGAEHKAVNAYEAGAPLDAAGARGFSRFHPRCGTSFVLVVMVVAIAVFSFLGRPPLPQRVALRIACLPLVAGVSYEIVRAGARFRWLRPVVLPGLWLQHLTTREPDGAQLDVAVRALREVVERDHTGVPV